ncbi:MAG: tetratricopeptide repeat protein [Crocinitomicaceae bacterium]
MTRIIKKTLICLVVFACCICPAHGQIPNSDSIKVLIEEHQAKDEKRVDLICDWLVSKSLDLDKNHEPYLAEALKISGERNYKEGKARSYFLFGWYYNFASEPQKSLEYSMKAIPLFKELGDKTQLLRTYANISNVYIGLLDFESALALNLKSIELSKEMPASHEKAGLYFYTAKAYGGMQDYESAEFYIYQAMEISEECGFQTGVDVAKGALGQNYMLLKQYDKALPLLKESLEFTKATQQTTNIAASYKTIGECYYYLKDYAKAIENLENAIDLYEDQNFKTHLEVIYNVLGEAHQKMDQLNQAIVCFRKSAAVAEELRNEAQTEAIEELKAKYKTKELKQEKLLAQSNEKAANEKEKWSRYTSYGLAIAAVIMIGSLFYIIRQLRIIRRQKKELDHAYDQLEESKKNELAVSNLKAIRSQMNPHLVFNSINSIQALVLDQNVEKSYDYIEKFSSLFRKTLNYSELNAIDLNKEIEFLNIYLDLESLRMKDEFSFLIKKSIDEEISIPTLLIQPFIENAIHHGLLHKEGEKRLVVEFKMDGERAVCIIEDNGIGREMSRKIKVRQSGRDSFSLGAIKKRLSLLGQQGGDDFDFVFEDLVNADGSASGTRVMIYFPHSFNY